MYVYICMYIYVFMCIRYPRYRCMCRGARFSVPIHRISATLTYRGFLSPSIPHTVRKSWATETNSPLTITEIRPWNHHWCTDVTLSIQTLRARTIRQIYSNFPINFRSRIFWLLITYHVCTHIYLFAFFFARKTVETLGEILPYSTVQFRISSAIRKI